MRQVIFGMLHNWNRHFQQQRFPLTENACFLFYQIFSIPIPGS